MSLRRKTIEELLDLEEELRQAIEEEKDGALHDITMMYEELYRKIRREQESEYASSLENIKQKLVSYLICYGTYMKMQYQKDDRVAKSSLQKALQYERELPIAHYRLGFLSYKQENYLSAQIHFHNATSQQKTCSNQKYKLNDQQMYNAHLYLSNSAFYMVQKAQDTLQKLRNEENAERAPHLEMSPLYEMITQNEGYLAANAFTIVTPDGEKKCSKAECENMTELKDTLILYFSEREHILIYNGQEKALTLNQAEMLRYFLLNTTEQSPAMKQAFT
ncbi:hypothetical protein V7068_17555 [Bacillus sp. JJ634]